MRTTPGSQNDVQIQKQPTDNYFDVRGSLNLFTKIIILFKTMILMSYSKCEQYTDKLTVN